MRITSKGQITIPAQIRRELGLEPGDEVNVVVDGNAARIVRAPVAPTSGCRAIDRLRGTANLSMSTDELLALLGDGD